MEWFFKTLGHQRAAQGFLTLSVVGVPRKGGSIEAISLQQPAGPRRTQNTRMLLAVDVLACPHPTSALPSLFTVWP
jgi:hypothetical protein